MMPENLDASCTMESTVPGAKLQAQGKTGLGAFLQERKTLLDLARHAEVSPSLIYKVSRGEVPPNQRIRDAVEELLGVPSRRLFGDKVAREWRRGNGKP